MKIKSGNYFFGLLAAFLIFSLGVSTGYAAPDDLPTLKLVKSVTTDDGGSAIADNWDLFASDGDFKIIFNQGGSGIFETVPANTILTLSESDGPGGYESGVWSCNGGDYTPEGEITLSNGDRVTCTITSDDIAPTLKLVKELILDDGGNASPDDWTLSASSSGSAAKRDFSNPGGSGVSMAIFANSMYDLSESNGPLGFTPSNNGIWNCDIVFPSGYTRNVQVFGVSLSEGDTAVCTITNDDDAPSIFVTAPTKINGKLTLSAEIKGFNTQVPVVFEFYKIDSSEQLSFYAEYEVDAPYNLNISPKNLDAGNYSVTASAESNGKFTSFTLTLNIPSKGNTG